MYVEDIIRLRLLIFYHIINFQGYSCVDLLNAGMRDSGVYYLQIRGTTYWFLKVYCEQENADGGWTVSLLLHDICTHACMYVNIILCRKGKYL